MKDIGALVLDTYEDPLEQLREGLGGFTGTEPIYLLQDPEDEMVVYYCDKPIEVRDLAKEDDHGSESESP